MSHRDIAQLVYFFAAVIGGGGFICLICGSSSRTHRPSRRSALQAVTALLAAGVVLLSAWAIKGFWHLLEDEVDERRAFIVFIVAACLSLPACGWGVFLACRPE